MTTYFIWAIWAHDTKNGTSQMVADNIDTPSTVEYLQQLNVPQLTRMVRERPAARVVFRIEDIERFLIPTTINTNTLETDATVDAPFVRP
jgi:hypothetical protein